MYLKFKNSIGIAYSDKTPFVRLIKLKNKETLENTKFFFGLIWKYSMEIEG